MQVVNSVIFSLLVFYTVKLQGQYAVFWLVYLITSCVGISAVASTYSEVYHCSVLQLPCHHLLIRRNSTVLLHGEHCLASTLSSSVLQGRLQRHGRHAEDVMHRSTH